MDKMVSVLSAVVHDLGHDGRNNTFHINAQDDLALTYNDRSVLENHHVSNMFRLLSQNPDANFLQSMPKEQCTIVRKEVIDMVLGTDMTQHFAELGRFKEYISKHGCNPSGWEAEDEATGTLRMLVLHASDISNPAKTFRLSFEWATRVLNECFLQGDEELRLKLPVSPLCDRFSTSLPKSQMGFIDFIVKPTFEALGQLVSKVSETCIEQLELNRATWESRQNSDSNENEKVERRQPQNPKAETNRCLPHGTRRGSEDSQARESIALPDTTSAPRASIPLQAIRHSAPAAVFEARAHAESAESAEFAEDQAASQRIGLQNSSIKIASCIPLCSCLGVAAEHTPLQTNASSQRLCMGKRSSVCNDSPRQAQEVHGRYQVCIS